MFGLVNVLAPEDHASAAERSAETFSHLRCPPASQWAELVADAGPRLKAFETKEKKMMFEPWADHMAILADIWQQLLRVLRSATQPASE